MFNHTKHDLNFARLGGNGLQGDLHIREKAGGIKALDISLELTPVEEFTGAQRNLAVDNPLFGLAANGLTIFIGGIAVGIEELNLDAFNNPFTHRKLHHTFRAHSRGACDACQGIPLAGIPLLQGLNAPLQGFEIEGAAVIGGENLLNFLLGKQGIGIVQHHLGQHRVG